MKFIKKPKLGFILGILVSLAMVFTGLFAIISVNRSYREQVVEYQNRHLLSVAASVTRSLNAYIDHFSNSITDFVQRSNVVSAEIRYRSGVDARELVDRMIMHLNMQQDIQSIMSMQDAEGLKVGTGSVYCSVPPEEHTVGAVDVHLTVSPNGSFYLGFCYAREGNVVYSLYTPMTDLLDLVASDIINDGVLFIADQDGQMVCLADRTGTRVADMEEIGAEYPGLDFSVLSGLLGQQRSVSTIVDLTQSVPGLGSSYLLSCTAIELGGNRLYIGAARDMAEVVAPMESNNLRITAFTVLMALGVLLLLLITLRTKNSNDQAEEEIRLLEEKTRLQEELSVREQKNFHAQRLQEVGTMAAGIVHEFNNLLTPIMGYSMMTLEQLPEDSEGYDNLLEVYNASSKAKGVIRQIGQLSRQNADLTYRDLELDKLVRDELGVATLARQGPVLLEASLNCPGILVNGSEIMLRQTILNLCINACQAMGAQGGTLFVQTLVVREGPQVWQELSVRDTGPGIDPAIQDRLFELFFTTKEAGVGTGLGLAISRHVVEMHGGTISAANNPGGGACFTVRLPVDPERQKPEQ